MQSRLPARNISALAGAAAAAAGWFLWLHRIGVNDFDDMLSNELEFASRPLSAIVGHLPWPDQSPLFFVVLHGVRLAGESPLAMQVFNALLLTVTLAGVYGLGLELAGSGLVAACAVALGALSPTSLWLVRSGRMYSLQVLFTTFGALLAARYLSRQRRSDLAGLAAISVLNIYTHFLGFLIAALMFVPVLVAGLFPPESRGIEREAPAGPRFDRQPWPVLIAGGAALVLVVPQVFRLVALLTGGAASQPALSLPGTAVRFLDRVSWFWFVQAGWGALHRADRVVTVIYIGSIVVLALAGVAAMGRRAGATVALWMLVPVLAFGMAAGHLDLRDRYLAWVLPLIWVAVATGGVGALGVGRSARVLGDALAGVRLAFVLTVLLGSTWLTWQKLPERYPQWTKLMTALGPLYRPSMVVYMPPGSTMGSPHIVVRQEHLPPGLGELRSLDAGTHAPFLDEAAQGREFVFLVYGQYTNDEMTWRVHELESRHYARTSIAVDGAHADVFTRDPLQAFSAQASLAPAPVDEAVVAWARQAAHGRGSASHGLALANALVARVGRDGVAHQSTLFASQRGESPAWKLGPAEWDVVEERRLQSGGVEQDMTWAHPSTGETLVVAFPASALDASLRLTYGLADSGLQFRAGAPVDVAVFVDGARLFDVTCPNTSGWKRAWMDTAAYAGRQADVVLLIRTASDVSRHFAFRLDLSSQPARGVDNQPVAGPVPLVGGRTLRDGIDHLRVYRLDGDTRSDATSDGRTLSAADMHEADGAGGAGSVFRRWALGTPPWDAVGLTRQVSAGVARDGLWAHPRRGTRLVLEGSVTTGELLRGFFGFTDYAAMQANGLKITAPVHLAVSVDGHLLVDQEAPRAAGWRDVEVTLGPSTAPHRLRVEISADVDSWGHFVFDLWSS